MKSLIIVFGALILIIATPFVFSAINDAITEEYDQSFSGVSTGAGVYSSNVTLGRDIWNADSTSITSIISDDSDDSPTAESYNSVSRVLIVSGLDESTVRTLSVEFLIDTTTLPTGVATFLTLLRWFWIFVIVGMVGGAIYAFFD